MAPRREPSCGACHYLRQSRLSMPKEYSRSLSISSNNAMRRPSSGSRVTLY